MGNFSHLPIELQRAQKKNKTKIPSRLVYVSCLRVTSAFNLFCFVTRVLLAHAVISVYPPNFIGKFDRLVFHYQTKFHTLPLSPSPVTKIGKSFHRISKCQ